MRLWMMAAALLLIVSCDTKQDPPQTPAKAPAPTPEKAPETPETPAVSNDPAPTLDKALDVIAPPPRKHDGEGPAKTQTSSSSFICPEKGCVYTSFRENDTCLTHEGVKVVKPAFYICKGCKTKKEASGKCEPCGKDLVPSVE